MGMAEYIEREALLEKARELAQNFSSSCLATPHIIKAIENAPKADVVEVVRCKDCKDYRPVLFGGETMHYGYCFNTHDSVSGNRHRYEGDYCSYGKRKEGAEE
jgi:hypothetical protein